MTKHKKLIGIVGPCKSGKSTLTVGLNKLDWNAKSIAQEHSFSQKMWKIISPPTILIYLDVDLENIKKRSDINLNQKDLEEQKKRLYTALLEADLFINTSKLSISEVLNQAISFLNN